MNTNLGEIAGVDADQWDEIVSRAMARAAKKEIAKLRQMKLPIIVSQNGKPVDINPDTNPEAPPWKD